MANRPPYITLVIAHIRHREVHDFCFCWKCFLIKQRRKKKTPGEIKSLFSAVFYDNQFCELIHAILQLADTHSARKLGKKKTNAHTHRRSIQTDIFWMLIICLQLHPTWKKWRKRQRKKGRKCQRANWQTRGFHNIPLYLSICIHLFVSLLFQMNLLRIQRLWSAACGAQINKND